MALKLVNDFALSQKMPFAVPNMAFGVREIIAKPRPRPPAPYRERAYAKGLCCVCGRPVYRFGWHVDLWNGGTNTNATWHCACVIAWEFWIAPSSQARLLRRLNSSIAMPAP